MYLALRLGSDLQIRIQRKWCSGTTTFFYIFQSQGQIQRGAIAPPKTYEINIFHHDFVQFGKHHWRYKAHLGPIVLSQQCCEVYFTSLTVVNS